MKKEALQNKTYEELVQLQQDGEITLVEFIEAQPDITEEWNKWIDTRPINKDSARAFLAQLDESVMDCQNMG